MAFSSIDKIFIHPDYTYENRHPDIAILKLHKKIHFHEGITTKKRMEQGKESHNLPCRFPCKIITPESYKYKKYIPTPKSECFTPGIFKGPIHDSYFAGMKVDIIEQGKCYRIVETEEQKENLNEIICTQWTNSDLGMEEEYYKQIFTVANSNSTIEIHTYNFFISLGKYACHRKSFVLQDSRKAESFQI